MANWLKAIGDSLIAGGELAGRNRARNLVEQRAKREDEESVLRMALARESQELAESVNTRAEASEGRAAALDTENRERRVIDDVGPGGVMSAEAAATITTPGLRSRLGTPQEQTLEATPFVSDDFGGVEQGNTQPAQQAGVPIIPTQAERVALTSAADADALRKIQLQTVRDEEKARLATMHPSFARLPQDRRAALWGQAGFNGNVPQTFEEQQQLLQAQHKLRLQELGIMYPSDRFGPDGSKTGGKLTPWMQSFNSNRNSVVSGVLQEARMAAMNGQPFNVQAAISQAMEAAEAMTSKMLGPNPDAPVGPVEPSGRPAASPAAAWLGTLDDPTFESLKAGLRSGDTTALSQLTQAGQTEEAVRRELCRVDRTFCGRLR